MGSMSSGMRACLLVIAASLGLGGCAGLERLAIPKMHLDSAWSPAAPQSRLRIDHGPWDAFLATYVHSDADGVNRVAYGAVTPQDRARLNAYIAGLAKTPVSRLTRNQQLAFWVNLYNALTVNLVLDHYPIKSIRKIKPHLFSVGPWGIALVRVEDREITLYHIENQILRPIWKDPRIHYLLNCAAVGCPNLGRRAVTAENAESVMEAAARAYINNPRGLTFDAKGRLILSKIYLWYREDFDRDGGVLAHLRKYANADLRRRLAGKPRIHRYRYDWALNDAGARLSRADQTPNITPGVGLWPNSSPVPGP